MSNINDGRMRNFTMVLYPESCPSNYIDIISNLHIPAFLSPLHDRDINADGEFKKPHFHLVLMYDGKKSFKQVQVIADSLCAVLEYQDVGTIRGMSRYLCHLDNPEKAQYNVCDVKSFCGADYDSIINLSTDKYRAIYDIISYCNDNDIIDFCDLLSFACANNYGWYRVMCDGGTIIIKEFLRSRYLKKQRQLSSCSNGYADSLKNTDCTIFVNGKPELDIKDL